MAPGLSAAGILGFAIETVAGTYQAPTKYVPFMSESLQWQQDTKWRRPIRQNAGIIGAVAGNGHVEGDISMEAFTSIVPYFLNVSRSSVIKSGAGPFTYTATPTHGAIPAKTMSITVVRNGIVFGYVGCVVGQYTFTVDDGTLMFNLSVQGRSEATQSTPTASWPTEVPFGSGQYTLEIPTASQVFDCDGFEFTCNDNATAAYRIKNSLGAQFISYGERAVTMSTTRDFDSRAEYDAFKNLTSQAITFKAIQDANNEIDVVMNSAIKDTYEVGLSGQGDLVSASVQYNGVINASGVEHTVVVKSSENFTP